MRKLNDNFLKRHSFDLSLIISGALLLPIGILMACFMGAIDDHPDALVVIPITLILIPALILALGIVMYVRKAKKYKKQHETQVVEDSLKLEIENAKRRVEYEVEFFLRCKKEFNIEVANDAASIARIKMISNDHYKYLWDQSEALVHFENGRKTELEREHAKAWEEFSAKLKKQQEQSEQIKAWASEVAPGKDKILKYFYEELHEYDVENKKISDKKRANFLRRLEASKDVPNRSNYNLAGFAVGSVLGPTMGASAAIDSYEKGEKRRTAEIELNQQILASCDLVDKRLNDEYRNLLRTTRPYDIRKNIEKAQKLLADDSIDEQELLSLIAPENIEFEQAEFEGYVIIKMKTRAATLNIYETIKACVDGFFKAIIYKNGEVVFERYYALGTPYASFFSNTLAPCYVEGNATDEYAVAFEPVKLWAIEEFN